MSKSASSQDSARRKKLPSIELRSVKPHSYKPIQPRPLLPLREPPSYLMLYPPSLPKEAQDRVARGGSFSDEYTLTTHLIPAAYPRTTPAITLPEDLRQPLPSDSTKEQRTERNKRLFDLVVTKKTSQMRGEIPPDLHEQRLLWNCINRYRRKSPAGKGRKSLTLLLFHANGFPKEIFEPFLAHLTSKLTSSSVSIDDIWAFEAVTTGDAALVNKNDLGFLYDWCDNTRDILHFLRYYLPSDITESAELPVHLPRLPESVSTERLASGFSGRTIVGVGHSFGGCTVLYSATHAPKLYKSLLLVDPVVASPVTSRDAAISVMTKGAVSRRDEWSSRDEARRLFSKTPFFAAWDPASLDVYIDFGLYSDVKNGKPVVRLKMPGLTEAMMFFENQTGQETYERLKYLDKDVKLHWVLAGKNPVAGSAEALVDIVSRRRENATNVIIPDSGHLIVQEAPEELADAAYMFFTEGLFGIPARL